MYVKKYNKIYNLSLTCYFKYIILQFCLKNLRPYCNIFIANIKNTAVFCVVQNTNLFFTFQPLSGHFQVRIKLTKY